MKNLIILLVLSLTILLSACKNNDILQVETIFTNEEIAINVSESRNDIFIQIDALTDTLYNRTDDNYEYASITFETYPKDNVTSPLTYSFDSLFTFEC